MVASTSGANALSGNDIVSAHGAQRSQARVNSVVENSPCHSAGAAHTQLGGAHKHAAQLRQTCLGVLRGQYDRASATAAFVAANLKVEKIQRGVLWG